MGYDGSVARHDPATAQMLCLPTTDYKARQIVPTKQGDLWVNTAEGALINVATDSVTKNLRIKKYFTSGDIAVRKVVEDSRGRQWILTAQGLFRYDPHHRRMLRVDLTTGYRAMTEHGGSVYFACDGGKVKKLHNRRLTTLQLPTRADASDLAFLSDGRLAVTTLGGGLFFLTKGYRIVAHHTAANTAGINSDVLRAVQADRHGDLWIESDKAGAIHYDAQDRSFATLVTRDSYGNLLQLAGQGLTIIETAGDNLWISPSGNGFAWFDRKARQLLPFYDKTAQDGWSAENTFVDGMADRQGNLWFCGKRTGLEKVTFNDNAFRLIAQSHNEYDLDTRGLMQDKSGRLWVGNKRGQVMVYDEGLHLIGNLGRNGSIRPQNSDTFGKPYCFAQDSQGRIWMGSKGDGLYCATPNGANSGFNITHFTHDDHNPYSLNSNDIYSLHVDRRQQLWIATFGGGLNCLALQSAGAPKFIHAGNQLRQYPLNLCNRVRFVTTDKQGRIWAGTTNGLLMTSGRIDNAAHLRFFHFERDAHNPHSLSYNDVHSILFTRRNQMLVCTYGGGFNRLLRYDGAHHIEFQAYGRQNGTESDALLSAAEDKSGTVWLASQSGLTRYNPDTGMMETYGERNFPRAVIMSEGNALALSNGTIVMATSDGGLLAFNPMKIKADTFKPRLMLTHLMQDGQVVTPGEGSLLATDLDHTRRICLPYRHNSFAITFSALDMKDPASISYAYKLKGFDKQWIYSGGATTATYTNLPIGSYTFCVRSTNSGGIWTDNTRCLEIVVEPPFYLTIWAWLIYIVGIAGLIVLAAYVLSVIFRLKDKVKMEEEISDIKLRFFTDISHELRTPLTLITGPLDELKKSTTLSPQELHLLQLATGNANRMKRLVTQLLDFRKIEKKKMRLHISLFNIVELASRVADNFESMANERHITLSQHVSAPQIMVWADNDKMEKILFNLLSNAFKFTPMHKAVRLIIEENEADVIITVQDEGVGISKEKQAIIFDRFACLDEKNPYASATTGIGLSLVKQLVELHHATIEVSSQPDEGSSFIVTLKKGRAHYGDDVELIIDDNTAEATPATTTEAETIAADERATLLIVEDNKELRYFLRHIFATTMNVMEAEDGLSALEQSRTMVPDIVVSDIMMPRMDGIELLAALRQEPATSHIPIILLTAKANIDDRIAGINTGADDYITKPFSAEYLKARVANLLNQRQALQAHFRKMWTSQPDDGNEPVAVNSERDRQLMEATIKAMEQNLANADFTVESLAQTAHMSRSVFYKKFKALTGVSPVEFIKAYRMKKAAELMLDDRYNIAQVAYMVGFSDPHYFSTCFRQQFGTTPTAYKKEKTGR